MTVHTLHSDLVRDTAAARRGGLLAAIGQLVAFVAARFDARSGEAIARRQAQQARRDATDVRRRAKLVRASNPGLADDLDMAVDRMERALAQRR